MIIWCPLSAHFPSLSVLERTLFCLISLPRPNVFSKGNLYLKSRSLGIVLLLLQGFCWQFFGENDVLSDFLSTFLLLILLFQVPPERTWCDETKFTNDGATYKESSGCSFSGLSLSSVLAISLPIYVWVLGAEGSLGARESLGARDPMTAYLEDATWNATALNLGWFHKEMRRLPACNAQFSESSWDTAFLVYFLWSSLWPCQY